ncbi:hypothetical protein BKA67DRAFT_545148 [Truncatella angustata]|uniref:RNA-binding S4 domain-containing protein n=1 Tax=Truncatella angustata TaxID=152316 RepID=A0A9P9A2P2_9PEZI|nr:uncharacterized protein BKA67DRAFT_545148 [Truncatella angustata]KAH6659627.1 hypothetical protein BKA67DRAFT_545148 [Truncatella angustata]
MAKGKRLHVLRRPKLRQSWNKYNLYNIWRQRDPKIGLSDQETFFQQKWRAKGLLRSYHGEHMKERDWERMFSRRLLSVANMDPRYMAEFDGSEKAAGRGSGQDETPLWDAKEIKPKTITPYMNMAFSPMERRLDIAIFRAMFASSARQARQMCIHGAVKVNGKKMPFPAYKLNPGDMFQVDTEKVMYATGKPKPHIVQAAPKGTNAEDGAEDVAEEAGSEEVEPIEPTGEASAEPAPEQDPDTTDKPEQKHNLSPMRKTIGGMVKQAKAVLENEKLGVTKKRTLRGFIKKAKKIQSESGSNSPVDIAAKINSLMSELNLVAPEHGTAEAQTGEAAQRKPAVTDLLTPEEIKTLERKIKEEEDNPYNQDKPYMTPWQPREFMSPFAFVPQYLEVNHNICSAVYLRHPVARVGSAEVPTPFGYNINQLAFNWYLRRR